LHSEWWQVPAALADLESVLLRLNALELAPPEGDTAFFCDFCEALIELLAVAERSAMTSEEDARIRGFRSRLERRLGATIQVDRRTIGQARAFAEKVVAAVLGEPRTKLATYGTLAPGEVNHGWVAGLAGHWHDGFVHGDLQHTGWGVDHGFPALAWRSGGPRVPVKLLISPDLPQHWPRLDAFEGEEYCRLLIPVHREETDDESAQREPETFAVANLYADRMTMCETR